ncbi:hypothetical protein VB773_00220 [Haloarculaceae archaeon H-GB2-1]|nr:hypothetical protein [Haloarculaceae archaeon H-GB1-1]MEA5406156.1 hypothetical protein [Haloarculaceae archaeon H-GB2-1]
MTRWPPTSASMGPLESPVARRSSTVLAVFVTPVDAAGGRQSSGASNRG